MLREQVPFIAAAAIQAPKNMKKSILLFLKFFLPFQIWLFLFKNSILGKAHVLLETYTIYSDAKVFTDNIMSGVFPLWNPFVMLGHPQKVIMSYFGAYNPIWLLMPFFRIFGVLPYQSFLFTIMIYFFLGMLGFYLLAKELFKNSLVQYAAFLMFLFSSFSLVLFPDIQPVIIFIPGVWFYNFLIRFLRTWEKKHLVGLTFSAMLVSTTYLPFYFLTVFLISLLAYIIVYFSTIPQIFKGLFKFFLSNKMMVFLCGLALFVSFFPGVEAFRSTQNAECVAPFRHFGEEGVFKKGVEVSDYDIVTDGGMTARMVVGDLYSRLDNIPYGNNGFIYIPLFGFIILFMGIILKTSRRLLYLFLFNLFLFLVLLEDSAYVHPWLYQNVYYFKLMRNMFFTLPYFVASLILLISELFYNFLKQAEERASLNKRGLFAAINSVPGIYIDL